MSILFTRIMTVDEIRREFGPDEAARAESIRRGTRAENDRRRAQMYEEIGTINLVKGPDGVWAVPK